MKNKPQPLNGTNTTLDAAVNDLMEMLTQEPVSQEIRDLASRLDQAVRQGTTQT